MKTATCQDCGAREQATHANPAYRCASCEAGLVRSIRKLAASGMSNKDMGRALQVGYTVVRARCRLHNIHTTRDTPQAQAVLVRGFGQPPAKLMPTPKALGLNSIWSVAGGVRHVSTLPA